MKKWRIYYKNLSSEMVQCDGNLEIESVFLLILDKDGIVKAGINTDLISNFRQVDE